MTERILTEGALCQVPSSGASGTVLPRTERSPGEAAYQLVKQASDQYRRAGTRVERARKALRAAEAAYDQARRDLRLAVEAVQPSLPMQDQGPEVPGL